MAGITPQGLWIVSSLIKHPFKDVQGNIVVGLEGIYSFWDGISYQNISQDWAKEQVKKEKMASGAS